MRHHAGVVLLMGLLGAASAATSPSSPVQLTLDTSEADQALRILDREAARQTISAEDWRVLFATAPYRWLKDREAAMGRDFTDESFEQFLQQPETIGRRAEWHQSLDAFKKTDMKALGTRVLSWLPPGATIRARVFPEIKPKHNSFVWSRQAEAPAICLYIEPQSRDKFENTVAHESHHIGLTSLQTQQEAIQAKTPPNVAKAMEWLGAFGEGEAMLAAAGSIDRHPHWEDDALTRARWDGDMMHFNADLQAIQQFITEILDGKLSSDEEIRKRAAPFYGDVQGAWYTVGYQMAVLVERQYGRQALDDCLLDPRKLLRLYNQVASQADTSGATLATWSPEFIARLNDTQH